MTTPRWSGAWNSDTERSEESARAKITWELKSAALLLSNCCGKTRAVNPMARRSENAPDQPSHFRGNISGAARGGCWLTSLSVRFFTISGTQVLAKGNLVSNPFCFVEALDLAKERVEEHSGNLPPPTRKSYGHGTPSSGCMTRRGIRRVRSCRNVCAIRRDIHSSNLRCGRARETAACSKSFAGAPPFSSPQRGEPQRLRHR
jgi:hypothetical protein